MYRYVSSVHHENQKLRELPGTCKRRYGNIRELTG
jgi:hypothetical protein